MTSRRHRSWVEVAVFENINDGRILETLLRDKEIEARTYHNKWLQAFLFLRPPHVTWRVQVRHDDYATASTATIPGLTNTTWITKSVSRGHFSRLNDATRLLGFKART